MAARRVNGSIRVWRSVFADVYVICHDCACCLVCVLGSHRFALNIGMRLARPSLGVMCFE